MDTVGHLIWQNPDNPVENNHIYTYTNKAWTSPYHVIQNLMIRTQLDGDGRTNGDFTTFKTFDDDALRSQQYAVSPNMRSWIFDSEADCELFFHTEVSNVVLAGWRSYPLVRQTSHMKPLGSNNAESVDATYLAGPGDNMTVIVIGEMKKNLIDARSWQSGNIMGNSPQEKLSKELRAYAHKYQTPQVYCFDGETLLLLQFRASKAADILSHTVKVDCWVFPREKTNVPLRYALYMLLSQGFRRFQTMNALPGPLSVGGFESVERRFFDGRPIWRDMYSHKTLDHPGGYNRSVDADGAVKWTDPNDLAGASVVYETLPFWTV
ncbi:hypothetical protein B0T24DRAFT_271170 [Lasiosphaeria ovina]|uniref:Uncharacterized protein n=1 Tax=Lasiosphaeria ovina TaxID=92902 RepID=A0AAE0KCJ5_9PEZI|nr:hypothetical protein B0T24DRAFT_271170 [Lasiosphaeria ovina]